MKLSRLLIIAITVLTFLAGCDQFEKKATDPQADKDIEAAYKARDYQKIILLADSFQQSGAMSDVKANVIAITNDLMFISLPVLLN